MSQKERLGYLIAATHGAQLTADEMIVLEQIASFSPYLVIGVASVFEKVFGAGRLDGVMAFNAALKG